jgi:hypothetical protein
METTTEYAVLEDDRCTAVELVGAALRAEGHRVEPVAGRLVVSGGARVLTALLGALVPPERQYQRYDLDVSSGPGHAVLTLRPAAHGAAVAGGMIGSHRRRAAWHRTTTLLETALHEGGVLLHRTDRIDTSGITLDDR